MLSSSCYRMRLCLSFPLLDETSWELVSIVLISNPFSYLILCLYLIQIRCRFALPIHIENSLAKASPWSLIRFQGLKYHSEISPQNQNHPSERLIWNCHLLIDTKSFSPNPICDFLQPSSVPFTTRFQFIFAPADPSYCSNKERISSTLNLRSISRIKTMLLSYHLTPHALA